MNYGDIKKYWTESLTFLTTHELKTFLLLTLNNVRRSLWIFLSNFWWLVLVIYFLMHVTNLFSISIFLSFLYILAARPSIENKDIHYFLRYIRTLLALLVMWLPLNVLSSLISNKSAFFIIPYALLEIIFILSALFYIDSAYDVKDFFVAIKNGCLATVSFLPFSTLLIAPLLLFFGLIMICATIIQTSFAVLFYLPLVQLFEFLCISAVTIFYIKIKHTYPTIFFGK